jgi:hypothetical protein
MARPRNNRTRVKVPRFPLGKEILPIHFGTGTPILLQSATKRASEWYGSR